MIRYWDTVGQLIGTEYDRSINQYGVRKVNQSMIAVDQSMTTVDQSIDTGIR